MTNNRWLTVKMVLGLIMDLALGLAGMIVSFLMAIVWTAERSVFNSKLILATAMILFIQSVRCLGRFVWLGWALCVRHRYSHWGYFWDQFWRKQGFRFLMLIFLVVFGLMTWWSWQGLAYWWFMAPIDKPFSVRAGLFMPPAITFLIGLIVVILSIVYIIKGDD